MPSRQRRPIVRREEPGSIELGSVPCAFVLKRSSVRRTMAVRVADDGRVTVNAPLAMPRAQIDAFLLRHADWLTGRLARGGNGLVWQPEMLLPYLGRELTLGWRGDVAQAIRLDGPNLALGGPWEQVPARIQAWYRQQAAELLPIRLGAICATHGLPPPPLRLSNARTRWGSLSARGVVGLNWRLIKASAAEIDYVICHELAHFRHRDHSAAFWSEVARLYPAYAAARLRLRAEGGRYFRF